MSLKIKKADRTAERTFKIANLPVEFRQGERVVHGHIDVEYLVLPESEFSELRNKGDYQLALRVIRQVSKIGTEDDPWTPDEQLEFALNQPEILAIMVRKYIEETKSKFYTRGN